MRIPLLGGAYQARSVIAAAQSCVNLYPEHNRDGQTGEVLDQVPVTHYLTPGLHRHVIPPHSGTGRCLYTATNGRLYYICGTQVFYIDSSYGFTQLGSLTDNLTTPVYMIDNGTVAIIVDGTTHGYAIRLSDNAFAPIVDPNFLGADRVDYVDTFFVLNQPGTKNFYSSLSNITYDSLTGTPGRPTAGTITNGGSGGTNGSYTGIALTGGSGTGATADITVAGGSVTVVTLNAAGLGYVAGDVLGQVGIPSLANFQYTLTAADAVAFDPTYVAAKTGFPDELATLCCVHREIWLFGIVKTTEVWYDAGGAAFPFAIMPGVFIERGCAAKYSVCKNDLSVFWLGLDQQGQGIVYKGSGYRAIKISTPAIEAEIASYAEISDAVGMMYQQAGHTFYLLTFPTEDVTWVFDDSEGLWHQRTWTDPDTGLQHRWRGNCCALAYGDVVTADWQNGAVYHLHLDLYNDFGGPIVRERAFPHLVADGKRLEVTRFTADMECGNGSDSDPTTAPTVALSWSVTRGRTFGTAIEQSLGAQGEFLTQPIWRQLGLGRDWVFKLNWSADAKTALQGAWIDATPSDS